MILNVSSQKLKFLVEYTLNDIKIKSEDFWYSTYMCLKNMTSTVCGFSQDFNNFSNFVKFSAIISDCCGKELSSVLNTFIKKIITHTKLLNTFKRNIIAFTHDLVYMDGETELLKNIGVYLDDN